ncbi:tetracycline-efflux [Moniliophthora roreri MCA 2997]|uniref:Tetracycline-efflux n=1 Tax=Moniliophthora roreri (strain MCA 2997) TaxID=1381753 RepID=V2XFV4_MONRO|nr:tetracycline-efflux [Moniliophthora roreri MCA 2997]
MASDETRPLLQSNDSQINRGRWFSLKSFPKVSLVIPVALGCRLAAQLPQSTAVYLIQQLACRQYYLNNDPSKVPREGRMSDELCSAPDVRELYTFVLTCTTLLAAFGSLAGFHVIGVLSARYGRWPVMLGTVTLALASNLFLITSQFMNDILEIVWLILWLLLDSVSNAMLMLFLVNAYVVDVVDAEIRTAALSTLNGWAKLGDGISFIIGGNITTYTNEILPVYILAASIQALTLVYIAFVLPESFSREKRDALRGEKEAEAARIAASRSHMSVHRRILHSFLSSLGPLKNLKPTYNERTGRRNWRLIILTIHIFLAMVGAGYVVTAMIIYLTSMYGYKAADTGYVLAIYSLSGSFTMAFIVPAVIKFLRPRYKRNGSQSESERDEPATEDIVSEITDRLDVHVTAVSWIIEGAALLLAAHMATRVGQYTGILLAGLSEGRNPVFRSLVAASVEPLKQGETLAAIEMVFSFGLFVSPLIMGTIYTSTIGTAPTIIFWVNAGIVISSSLILLLVRESDRYQRSEEEGNHTASL